MPPWRELGAKHWWQPALLLFEVADLRYVVESRPADARSKGVLRFEAPLRLNGVSRQIGAARPFDKIASARDLYEFVQIT